MAERISINTERAGSIYTNSITIIAELQEQINSLVKEIDSLETEGEWAGASCDRFFNEFNELRPKMVTEFPETLTTVAENLNINLKNLVEADAANA